MKLDGRVDGFGHGADGAGELAEVAVPVAGLNGLHRGSKRCLIFDGLGHEPKLGAESGDLGSRGSLAGEDAHGRVLGIGQAISSAHAEGIVDDQQHQQGEA
jgi:hypothetical protein